MLSQGLENDNNRDDIDDEGIHFEESFNVTNMSDENNYNELNYNIADDQNMYFSFTQIKR